MRTWILALAGAAAVGQTIPGGRVSGIVVRESDGAPLRRAHVVLRPLEAGIPALGADADDKGSFEIREIPRGTYSLTAQRDGYLGTSIFFRGAARMPPQFSIAAGQTISQVTFRLKPWATLAGKVRFNDGDPAVGVPVQLYREYHVRGRHGFTAVRSAVTDDHGDYRVYDLAPGVYYMAAIYEKAPATRDVRDQPRLDDLAREIPSDTYATTFYPDTLKLGEAVPIRLGYGGEIGGIDLFLQPVRKASLRGQVTDGTTGLALSSATIFLERLDAGNTGTLPLPERTEFDKDSNFTIRQVAPGSYQVWADATSEGHRLIARTFLNVAGQDVDQVNLLAVPAHDWQGVLRMDGELSDPRANTAPRVTLEPRSERGAIAEASPGFNSQPFAITVMADETYDVFVRNLPDNFYVSAVRVNGTDVRALGLAGSMAGGVPFEIMLDSRGGRVDGRVYGPNGDVWSGANLALIPESPAEHWQSYRETAADEYGAFKIAGVPPGKYTLVGWLDDPPCDVYDPDGLEACRVSGTAVTVDANSQQTVALNVKAPRAQ
ncbi:MAG TPA: carboxypeptidase-like regulatory domain-containing protein [Bryobacteraceae bacterium]